MDAVSWAAVLPQTLAALGAMFALAGVGPIIAGIVQRWIPLDTPFVAVVAYTVGMALFTAIMGNAFAAFPVMTAGIGLPLIVHQFGGNVVDRGRGRNALRILRNAHDADGGELQHRPGRAARASRRVRGHQGADADRAAHARGEHGDHVSVRLSQMTDTLTPELATKFATLALAHVTREYPNKLDHVLNGPDDLRSPRRLHPIFFGSFDWHSNVHGYWLLATIYRRLPELTELRDADSRAVRRRSSRRRTSRARWRI